MIFNDRTEAGHKLAERLRHLKPEKPIVVALPRGGLPVAYEIAQALEAPLDIILVRKIGAPGNPEFAVGAVADGVSPVTVVNRRAVEGLGIRVSYIERQAEAEFKEIERRRRLYLGDRARTDMAGRTVIVVDDGVATGTTTRAALRALRRRDPARLVLAVPVAAADTLAELKDEADEIVCLYAPADFGAVGYFYMNFAQVDDAEVVDILRRAAERPAAQTLAKAEGE